MYHIFIIIVQHIYQTRLLQKEFLHFLPIYFRVDLPNILKTTWLNLLIPPAISLLTISSI
jgi:hypothetical protein